MQVVDLLPVGEGTSEDVVERWVSAELAKAAALRDLDDQLYPDEIEGLADEPPTVPGLRVYRMIRLRGADVDVVFLRLLADDAAAKITLLGVSTRRGP